MSPRVWSLPSILLLVLMAPCAAWAAWPNDPSVGNVPLCTATGQQTDVTSVSDGAGGAIVTWMDLRGADTDIYVQRVNAAGVPQWAANGVALCTATNEQNYPTIVSDGAGGAIVTWHDLRSGNWDVYAQRVDASGAPQWTAGGVGLAVTIGDQQFPTIVSDNAGGAIVTWWDTRNGNNDVFAQRVIPNGTSPWPLNGKAVCTNPTSQVVPTIASDGAGGAIITWYDFRNGNWDVFAQRMSSSGVAQWTANGEPLAVVAGDQTEPKIVSDGAGGAIVTWQDTRNGNADIYAQRTNASGAMVWPLNGVALCTATGAQNAPVLASDGSGGAIVGWYDARTGINDIYSQRVGSNGAAQWTANGVALCLATGVQLLPTITSDGAGGAIVAWYDFRSGIANDVYAQRVTSTGVAAWTADGSAICTAGDDQRLPAIVPDGAGGALIAWQDLRSGNRDIYVQRIERFGYLGNPEPVIASVRDVVNDQGGKVKVTWSASYRDVDPLYGILEYRLWRSVPTSMLLSSSLMARTATADPDEAAANGRWLVTTFAAMDNAWELVATQPAAILPSYSLVASTTSDSVFESNPHTAYMVEARAGSSLSSPRWFSAPDSGYSVDNLAPAPPQALLGTYSGGSTVLHWGVSTEADFAVYRLYRGSSAGFVPGPSNLVTSSPDTGYVDAVGEPSYYKLSAVDVNGNESGYAVLTPEGTVDVIDEAPLAFALEGVRPNPTTASRMIVSFALPTDVNARLELIDVKGRVIASRDVGALGAGRHVVDLARERRLAAGVYLVRLTQGGQQRTTRAVVLD